MKYFIVLFCCFSLLACHNTSDDHIAPDKMALILTDLQIAEAYSTMVGRDTIEHRTVEKNMDSLAHYYKEILAHHHITMDELNKSLEWYRMNPTQLDTVYNKMIPELTALQGKIK